ncbi:MAG: hypothetical protein J6B71_09155 [Clostridia bacterium]|nr:hypothetical protein [Clostridia bacterium]
MGYRVYPVTQTELFCRDYTVLIDGKEVPLNSARVSAVPFNRYWPGHQRQIEQTELINFLSFSLDAPVTLEIVPHKPFERVELRPASAELGYEITGEGHIVVTLKKPQYFTVEPYGRNHALHVFADPMPQYDIDQNDPNLLYFGAGEHDVGLIELKSNQTLYLDEGAVVYARILAERAENIRILGRGILDNSRNKEEILFEATAKTEKEYIQNAIRYHAVELNFCERIRIEGITVRDSLVFTIRPTACRDIEIQNVKIFGNWRYNSDGIDMHNCRDVLIENCFIRTFDDCICAKGLDWRLKNSFDEKGYDPKTYEYFKNLHVKGCVLWNDWGKCLEIGAETCAEEMCDILFEDCDILHVTSEVLDCMNVDYAEVHDVTYRNIRIELDEVILHPRVQKGEEMTYADNDPDPDYTPILICVRVSYHHLWSAGGERRGINRNITFEDIFVSGRQKPILWFKGYDADYTTCDVTVRGLYHNGVRVTSCEQYELRQDEFCKNISIS